MSKMPNINKGVQLSFDFYTFIDQNHIGNLNSQNLHDNDALTLLNYQPKPSARFVRNQASKQFYEQNISTSPFSYSEKSKYIGNLKKAKSESLKMFRVKKAIAELRFGKIKNIKDCYEAAIDIVTAGTADIEIDDDAYDALVNAAAVVIYNKIFEKDDDEIITWLDVYDTFFDDEAFIKNLNDGIKNLKLMEKVNNESYEAYTKIDKLIAFQNKNILVKSLEYLFTTVQNINKLINTEKFAHIGVAA